MVKNFYEWDHFMFMNSVHELFMADNLSINSQITRNISWSVCGGNSGDIYMTIYDIRVA